MPRPCPCHNIPSRRQGNKCSCSSPASPFPRCNKVKLRVRMEYMTSLNSIGVRSKAVGRRTTSVRRSIGCSLSAQRARWKWFLAPVYVPDHPKLTSRYKLHNRRGSVDLIPSIRPHRVLPRCGSQNQPGVGSCPTHRFQAHISVSEQGTKSERNPEPHPVFLSTCVQMVRGFLREGMTPGSGYGA